ncbi:MAG: sterol desaturase family protein [Mariprofundaceae bacterium]
MAIWEIFHPRRALKQNKTSRWTTNFLIVLLNSLLLRLFIPTGAIGAAIWAESNHIGLLNLISLPDAAVIFIAVILLDLAIYVQHLVVHAVPILWRLHMVHHADQDIDVSTALRFHPLEIVLSMIIKIGVVLLLGAPAEAVLIFEIILNGMAMFNHANVYMPKSMDKILRILFVTPDMHRVHHSIIKQETNSNFGFNLSIWDRLFGTYIAQPEKGHEDVVIGLSHLQNEPTHQLKYILALPFRDKIGQYPLLSSKLSSKQGDYDE